MNTNGANTKRRDGPQTPDRVSHVTWQTEPAIALPIGAVWASGEASPQVRSPQRLAAVGDVDTQIGHIRQVIVEGLAGALVGMEPTVDDLLTRRDEIASLALVAANARLAAVGVTLLDLKITALHRSDA